MSLKFRSTTAVVLKPVNRQLPLEVTGSRARYSPWNLSKEHHTVSNRKRDWTQLGAQLSEVTLKKKRILQCEDARQGFNLTLQKNTWRKQNRRGGVLLF